MESSKMILPEESKSDVKTLKRGSRTSYSSSVENNEENGVRVSKDFGGDDGDGDDDASLIELDGEIREMSESKNGKEEGLSDGGEYEFCVGDFVWGKIKSYPWWPGQIYDSSDASDLALKVKQRGGRFLVAYFDGTFAWCHPSQLKPFEENFEDMSKLNSSKNFVNAVKNAVDEIGRLVELKMTCSCVSKQSLGGLGRALVMNSGIREGVFVPESGNAKLWNFLFEPAEFLAELKDVARTVSVTNVLEFTELKCWLSAFYRAKGGYRLASYHEPKPIPGLDDNSKRRVSNGSQDENTVEVPIQGPDEEDWLASPNSPRFGQTHSSLLQKCVGASENGQYQRRKQKSIAEIMEDDMDTPMKDVEVGVAEEGIGLGTMTRSSGRKMRQRNDEANSGGSNLSSRPKRRAVTKLLEATPPSESEVHSVEEDDSDAKEETKKAPLSRGRKKTDSSPGTMTISSGRKMRQQHDEANSGGSNSSSRPKREVTKLLEATPPSDSEVHSVEEDYSDFEEETKKTPSSRRRKKKDSSVHNDDSGSKEEAKKAPLSRGRKKKDSNVHNDDSGSEEETKERKGFLSRERKKSKYLSPPYTSMNLSPNVKGKEAESLKVSNGARLAERMTKVAASLIGSRHEKSDDSSPLTLKQVDQNDIIDAMKVQAPTKEVLSGLLYTAINHCTLEENYSLDMVRGFLSIFRSCVYFLGSNYEYYNKSQPGGRKRKSIDSEPGSLARSQNLIDQKSPEPVKPTIKMNEETRSDEPKLKQAAGAPAVKTKDNETVGKEESDKPKVGQATRTPDVKTVEKETDGKADLDKPKVRQGKRKYKETDGKAGPDMNVIDKESGGKASPAYLLVTFGPGSCLPSKDDLLKIYGKFGAIDETETDMHYINFLARIAFLRNSDAEEAFNSSQLSSPFGAASVTFRLRYSPPTPSRMRQLKKISNAKTVEKESGSKSSVGEASVFRYIRQKLEVIASTLENSDGKISLELKSKLEGEVKGLLDKVSTVVDSSSP